jgi:imidazolonepropionase-like amidohydrolase
MAQRGLVAAAALLFASSACGQQAGSPPPAGTQVVAFVHATVIPMDTERLVPDQTVLTAGGTILLIGPSSSVKVPATALRIDATGRYLLPALADMHVHLLSEAWNMMLPPEAQAEAAGKVVSQDDFLFPFIANGVTMVQGLSATPPELALRQRIERGEVLGPRLILARMIDAPGKAWPQPLTLWAETAAQAREAVEQAKAEGYDKMKVYTFLEKEPYDAVISTAHQHGMDVVGHIPAALSVEYVLEAGQKMIAHTEEIARHAHGDYRLERIDYYADIMARRGVWLVPTLVTTRAIMRVHDDLEGLLNEPEHVYYQHPLQQAVWSFIANNLYKPHPPEVRKRIRDDFERLQRPLTKAFHDKGGKLLVGTDAAFPGLVPGFALHKELVELVSVGLTPYEVLKAATTEPFEYLGEADRAGTIAVGKRTDLLLLDDNPLQDVRAASKISGVLLRGRWIGAAEIQRRMEGIAAAHRAAAP